LGQLQKPKAKGTEMNDTERNETPREPDAQEETAREHTGPRRFYRSPRDRVIAGVAGGLGRYFRVDPIFFRIGFVALAVFGGVGFLLYGAAWLLVPLEGGTGQPLPRMQGRALTITGAVVLVIAGLAALGQLGDGGWGWWWWGGFFGPLALIAVAGFVSWALLKDRRPRSAPDARWIMGRIALAAAILAGATVLFVGAGLAAAAGGGVAVATIVVAVGLVLAAAAFRGGARWLILPALLIALPAGVVSAADVDLDGGVGDRHYRPASVSDLRDHYQLGIGHLEVDLRDVTLAPGDRPLQLDVGIGAADLIVPDNVCVALDSRIGAGYVRLFDRDSNGLNVDWDTKSDAGRKVPRLVVKGDVGMGALQVVHDPSDIDRGDRFGPRFDSVGDTEGNVGCATP
jgi:phage shock protein PspC (stress-responsive transcriptional regulator)/predicted membrane protein